MSIKRKDELPMIGWNNYNVRKERMVNSLEYKLLGLLPSVLGVAKVAVRCRLQILRPLQLKFTYYSISSI